MDQRAEPAQDEPERVDRPLGPDLDRFDDVYWMGWLVVTTLRSLTPIAPFLAATSSGVRSVAVDGDLADTPGRSMPTVTVSPACDARPSIRATPPKAPKYSPLTEASTSPDWTPAASAGEPGCTVPTWKPIVGSPYSASPVKITKASSTFISTPATRIQRRTGSDFDENARGSFAASPSSPSSLTNPPSGSQLSE